MTCWCYGACYKEGCSAFPEGRRNPEDPWGPLLPPSDKAPLPDLSEVEHGNGMADYGGETDHES